MSWTPFSTANDRSRAAHLPYHKYHALLSRSKGAIIAQTWLPSWLRPGAHCEHRGVRHGDNKVCSSLLGWLGPAPGIGPPLSLTATTCTGTSIVCYLSLAPLKSEVCPRSEWPGGGGPMRQKSSRRGCNSRGLAGKARGPFGTMAHSLGPPHAHFAEA